MTEKNLNTPLPPWAWARVLREVDRRKTQEDRGYSIRRLITDLIRQLPPHPEEGITILPPIGANDFGVEPESVLRKPVRSSKKQRRRKPKATAAG